MHLLSPCLYIYRSLYLSLPLPIRIAPSLLLSIAVSLDGYLLSYVSIDVALIEFTIKLRLLCNLCM